MIELANEILLKMKIKEHFEGDKKRYVLTKEQLIEFVMKYNKLVNEVENGRREINKEDY